MIGNARVIIVEELNIILEASTYEPEIRTGGYFCSSESKYQLKSSNDSLLKMYNQLNLSIVGNTIYDRYCNIYSINLIFQTLN